MRGTRGLGNTMAQAFLDPEGGVVPESSLTVRRARELVAALRGPGASYASLIACRSDAKNDTVVFEVEVERPQIVANGIQRRERLAAVFGRDDETYPEVLSLRSDFAATLHLNQRFEEFPRSLCLYNRPWSEVRTTWTAPAFLERVRWWLSETACDSLHGETQALESFIISWGHWLVLPTVPAGGKQPDAFAVHLPNGKDGRVFIANGTEPQDKRTPGARCVVLQFAAPLRRHGVAPRIPKSLADLSELLRSDDFDLLKEVRERLKQWPKEQEPLLEHNVIILVKLSKCRLEGGTVESVEHLAFLVSKTVLEVGAAVGVWTVSGKLRSLLIPIDTAKNGADLGVFVLNVCHAFSRKAAALLNGLDAEVDLKVVAIGAGALGSQVAMNLARAGWGRWTVIDQDDLLPHNLARHALDGPLVGQAKAPALAFSMNSLFMNMETATSISTDVLRPGAETEKLATAVRAAEVLLDLSAAVAVARHLAAADSPARRISLFLSPSGEDLVLLSEDKSRMVRLDHLEMTYYLALAMEESLDGHLTGDAGPLRYGLSCRDVSSRIPQESVAMFAGIGARAVRNAADTEGASIRIWRSDSESLGVLPITIEPEAFKVEHFGDWAVYVAPSVIRDVVSLREGKLPKETGGVLIGGIDHEHRAIFVMLALASPPDSEEWPTHYIRGCEALKARVSEIEDRTAMNLGYVGEWHSHPNGIGTAPSTADAKVFGWIAAHTLAEGKPPVMLIAGENHRVRLLVGTLGKESLGVELCL